MAGSTTARVERLAQGLASSPALAGWSLKARTFERRVEYGLQTIHVRHVQTTATVHLVGAAHHREVNQLLRETWSTCVIDRVSRWPTVSVEPHDLPGGPDQIGEDVSLPQRALEARLRGPLTDVLAPFLEQVSTSASLEAAARGDGERPRWLDPVGWAFRGLALAIVNESPVSRSLLAAWRREVLRADGGLHAPSFDALLERR